MARIFGSDATPNGLRFQFTDRFKPVAKRQLDMLAAGEDPKNINLEDCKHTKGGKGQANFLPRVSLHSSTLQYLQASNLGFTEIASLMGSDTSVIALKSEIAERTKAIGRHQIYMRDGGEDPSKINISSFDSRKSRQGQML